MIIYDNSAVGGGLCGIGHCYRVLEGSRAYANIKNVNKR